MTRRFPAAAVLGISLLTAFLNPASAAAGSRKLLAMVAIENYQPPLDKVPDAKKSAIDLGGMIERQFGFQLQPLYDSDANLPAIDALLARFPEDLGDQDQVIFYFVGHGITRAVNGQEQGFLVPYGAQADSPVGQLLPMSRLVDRLSRLNAGEVWIVLDSCHSGISIPARNSEANPVSSGSAQGRRVRMVLTSSAGAERSYAVNQPLLTRALQEVLGSVSCDLSLEGFCSVFDISLLAKRKVQGELEKLRSGAQAAVESQTPRLAVVGGAETEDIRLNLVSQDEWRRINEEPPTRDTLDQFQQQLNRFKGRYPWYSDRVEARRTQVLLKLLKEGSPIQADNFKGLILQGLPGRVAQHNRDGQNYVWAPKLDNSSQGDFWMGQTEVSVAAYRRVFKSAAKLRLPGFYRKLKPDDYPVVNVSYANAQAYCALVGGALPTKDEWLYAATDGHPDHPYPWASGEARGEVATMARGTESTRPTPVQAGYPQTNAFQLHDVLGNVAEWIATDTPGGRAPIRGGSFADPLGKVDLQTFQDADREGANTIGFRCVIHP